MNFQEIPQMPRANYRINASWDYIESWIKLQKELGNSPT